MSSFITSRMTVASSKSTSGNGVFNGLTPPLNSTNFEQVRFGIDVEGRHNCNVRVGVAWSNDGVIWNPTFAESVAWDNGVANWKSTEGWSYGDGYISLSALTYSMLFLRFGVFARSASGSVVRNAQVRLKVDAQPVPGARTLAAGPLVIASGTTSTPRFYAMTEAISTSNIVKVRAAWEMTFQTGGAETVPAYQTSDDGVTWGSATALAGSTYLTTDSYYVGLWETPSPSLSGQNYIRFGMFIRTSAGSRDMCQASLRIDTRGL